MEKEIQIKLSKEFCEYLQNKPETGMGYQIVNIELKDGRKFKNRLILNSTYLKLNFENELKNEDIKEIKVKEI